VRAWLGFAAAVLAAAAVRAQPSADLERIQAAIAESRDRVAAYEREQRGLLEAIDAIDQSAGLLRVEAARARRAADEARATLEQTERTMHDAAAQLAELERAMAQRAVALYRAGELGTLQLLFSAGGLRDFFSRVQTLRRLLRHDADLVARHREQARVLEEARANAASANAAASAADETLRRRTGELDAERERKRALASHLGKSRALARGALTELEQAGAALEETVAAWRGSAEPTPEAPPPDAPPFPSLRGRLPDPVHGAVLGRFGRVLAPDARTATFRKGVVFEAPVGTPVYAVAAGRVRYAGRFRGYGNVVILDHGSDHFTVSAHLDRIDVQLGAPVAAGTPIGAVGDTGSLEGPQLYFEIRRGAEALDPEEWLARRPMESADAQRGEAERRPEPERERKASAKARQGVLGTAARTR
jgi:septal ring factor EnvC (AmiA/AmiB activator)